MKYWAYVNNEILGPFEKEKLLELPSFSPSLLVCPQTPVGEKTEDWKEAATYPELSALIASGSSMSAPKTAPAPAASEPAGAQEPAHRDIVEPAPAITTFKPLTASAIDPVAPVDHKLGGVDIAVNRLGKAGGEPAAAPAPQEQPAAQASSSFDPLTLSSISRKAEELPGLEKNIPAPQSFEAPKPALAGGAELETFARPAAFSPAPATAPAPAPAPAPEPEPAPAPAPTPAPAAAAAAAPAFDMRAVEALAQKLDAISKNSVSRQDMSAMVDPLRMKLDQMGEVISSMKNQQFQREIMDKLSFLENAVGEIRASMKQPPQLAMEPAAASITPAEVKESGRTIFGAQAPAPKKEEPKPAPEQAPAKIVDTGSAKGSRIAGLLKKLSKLVMTLVLLAAVLIGGVVFLKNFGIFDATGFIPFPLPFVQKPAAEQPAAEPQPAAEQPQAAQPGQPAQAQPEAAPAAQQPKAPDLSPEIIYFTRTYKLSPNGPTLEDKIAENSAGAGGDYNRVNWQVKQGVEGIYEISALVPGKGGELSYTYVADYNKKTLLPGDALGRMTLESLSPKQTVGRKPPARPKKAAAAPARRQAAPARKPAAKAAAKPAASQDDEYEYVYEDDEGTGQ